MADITNLFKATVKTVRARQKAQGVTLGPDKSILPSSKLKSLFAGKAKDVVSNISKLRDFLLQYRKDYINSSSLLGREASRMTDAERDQIDADAQTFMRTCSEAIKVFRKDANTHKVLPQVKEHRHVVFIMVEDYLKEICRIYSEQRAIRVKRVVDRKKIGRLEPEKRRYQSFASHVGKTEKPVDTKGTTIDDTEQKKRKMSSKVPDIDQPPIVFDEEDELSPEEAQMYEQENEQLYQEMNSLVDEVKQVEGKVVEISRLQEIFTSKVLEQEVKIDTIADTVAGATDNIKDANEEIREAMKNNAGLRVWILFFLIVCSFSLLFLDWYNA